MFALVSDEVRAELDRFGVTDLVGKDAYFTGANDIMAAYKQRDQ